MIKSELRKEFLKKRSDLQPDEVIASSRLITDRFFAAVDLGPVRTLHSFISIPKFNEVDTSLIIRRIWSEHPDIRTVAPKAHLESGELEHIAFSPQTLMVENSWGISEPTVGAKVEPPEIDLVIVPLLCFDLSGERTGYGKGFYDRFLAACRPDCIKIGVSHFGPVDRIDDVREHDVRLNACVTPGHTYTF